MSERAPVFAEFAAVKPVEVKQTFNIGESFADLPVAPGVESSIHRMALDLTARKTVV